MITKPTSFINATCAAIIGFGVLFAAQYASMYPYFKIPVPCVDCINHVDRGEISNTYISLPISIFVFSCSIALFVARSKR
jgi:hypothetical protein